MKWFYASGKEKEGPVDEEGLEALVASGEVTAETLVWHEGMAAWKPYGEVKGGSGSAEGGGGGDGGSGETVRCAYSGEMREKTVMLQYGEQWVAAEHKEAFVQALQQGRDVSADETMTSMFYVGFWWRVLASVIDWAVKLVPNILFSIPYFIWYIGFAKGMMENSGAMDPEAMAEAMSAELPQMLGGTLIMMLGTIGFSMAYETWMVGKYGGTVGKLALGFKIVNADGTRVSYLKSFGRWWSEALVKLIAVIFAYIPFIVWGVMIAGQTGGGAVNPEQMGSFLGGMVVAYLFAGLLGLLGGFGYWMAGIRKEKTALHDVMCKTRVVRKA